MLKRTALAGLGLVLLVSPLLASAQSLSDLQAQIAQLLAQIQVLQQQANQGQNQTLSSSSLSGSSCISLSNSMSLDDTDADTNGDVSKLQQFLSLNPSIYPEARVTGYFGPATQRAVQRWQSANGLVSSGDPDTTGYGYAGPKTRAAMAASCGGGGGGGEQPTQPTQAAVGITGWSIADANPDLSNSDDYRRYEQSISVKVIFSDGSRKSYNVGKAYGCSATVDKSLHDDGRRIFGEVNCYFALTGTGFIAYAQDGRFIVERHDESARDGSVKKTVVLELKGQDTTQPTEPIACPMTMVIIRCAVGYHAGGTCNQECIPDDNTGGVSFSASPSSGAAPLAVTFSTRIAGNRPTGMYVIDFGDGQTAEPASCANEADRCTGPGLNYHTYTSAGTYAAKLYKNGCPKYAASAALATTPLECTFQTAMIGSATITVTDTNTNTRAPVVNGIDGPASLNAGQVGKWTVNASVPNQPGAQLSYSVVWGDESFGNYSSLASSPASASLQTSATFTHIYKYNNTYKPKFTVSNSAGSASAEMAVAVGQFSVSILYEQVKCVFNGAATAQKCWGDVPASAAGGSPTRYDCSGAGTCTVSVKGPQNTPITWGSSCGGSANTTIDGQSEYANFSCGSNSSTGTLTIETDQLTPKYTIVSGGSTGVELGTFKFHAAGESITLNKIGLILSTDSAYSGDLTKIFLYNSNGSIIGTTVFVGNGNTATVVLSQPITIQKDTDVRIRVGGEIARIGTGQSGRAGDLVRMLVTSASGTGVSSGMLISAGQLNSSPDTIAGVRIFRSYPVVAWVPLPASGLADGKLLRFKVTASPSGDVGLNSFSVTLAPSNATVSNMKLYAYTDNSYSNPVAGFQAGGLVVAMPASFSVGSGQSQNFILQALQPVEVPAGATYYFEFRGTVVSSGNGSVVTTTLNGDSVVQQPILTSTPDRTSGAFIWSPNDFTTSQPNTADWTNGYGVEGLSGGGISQTRTGGTEVPIANNTRLTVTAPASVKVGSSYVIEWGGLSGPTLAELARKYPTALGEMIAYNSDQSLGIAQTVFGDEPIGTLLNGNTTWQVKTLTNDGRQLPAGTYSVVFHVCVPGGGWPNPGGNCTGIAQGNSSSFSLTSGGGTTSSSITVTAPNGGEQWEIGQLNTIAWAPYGYNPDVNPSSDVKAYLEKKVGNEFNSVYEIIPGGKASIHWEGHVRDMVTNEVTYPTPGQYYVHVINNKTWVGDWSDAPFTLLPRAVDMKVNGSDGPLTLSDNQPITITLNTNKITSCTLTGIRGYSGGPVYQDSHVPMSGSVNSYSMYASTNGAITARCIRSADGSNVYDTVYVNPIATAASLQITSPNGGERIDPAKEMVIQFSSKGLSSASVALYKNDQWKYWINKAVQPSAKDLDFVTVLWTPSTALTGLGESDNAGAIFKIYATGQKSDGTGYVEDKSDVPFSFVATAQPSAPTLTFTANPSTINAGQDSTLNWTIQNATNCVLVSPMGGWEGSPSETFSPMIFHNVRETYTANLTCTGPGGSVTKSVTVTVQPAQTATPALTLSVSPAEVPLNGSTTMTWSATNVSFCDFSHAGTYGPVSRATSGSLVISPVTNSINYQVTCDGPNGSISKMVLVRVVTTPAPTLTFTANPTTVTAGQSATLSWSSTNAYYCSDDGGKQDTNGYMSTGALYYTRDFTMTCPGAGGSVTKNVTVNVQVASPTGSVDLKVNGSDGSLTLADNQPITVSLSTNNIKSCTISGIRGVSDSPAEYGSWIPMIGNYNEYSFYSYVPNYQTSVYAKCTGNDGSTVSDSVTVYPYAGSDDAMAPSDRNLANVLTALESALKALLVQLKK